MLDWLAVTRSVEPAGSAAALSTRTVPGLGLLHPCGANTSAAPDGCSMVYATSAKATSGASSCGRKLTSGKTLLAALSETFSYFPSGASF